MADESARSIFFHKDNKDKRLIWNLQHLAHKLIVQLRHQPVTQQMLQYVEETALFIARVAQDLHDRLPPDSAQPMCLNNGCAVDFSNLQ